MKETLLILCLLVTFPTSAQIIMDDVKLKGFRLEGTAVDNGAPYSPALRCANHRTDCKWGVRVKFYHGIFSQERWISATVLTRSDGTNAPSYEAGRQAWTQAYGTTYTFTYVLPFYAKYPRVCWGASTTSPKDFAPCNYVSPGPVTPVCSGSAGTIDFGTLQQNNYHGAQQATAITITCSAAVTIRFTSGNNVTLNNGTQASLTFNGVSQGNTFTLRAGNNSVSVNARLSGTPTLGNFTGSSTVILNVL